MGSQQSSRRPQMSQSDQDDDSFHSLTDASAQVIEDGDFQQVSSNMDYTKVSAFLCLRRRKEMDNVTHSLLVRQLTGHSSPRSIPHTEHLKVMGGDTMYSTLDKASSGMVSDCSKLKVAIQQKDIPRISSLVAQIAPRLIGDPNLHDRNPADSYSMREKVHIEREYFVFAGGIGYFKQIFTDPSIVGSKAVELNDAREYNTENVVRPLVDCWNEIMISTRDIVFNMPEVVGKVLEGNFLPFLFTLLSHDACFDAAATLIEEILSLQSQKFVHSSLVQTSQLISTTFYLSEVPRLFELWRGFTCRQLAYFCRILALLVFEPEDRQLMEATSVLKSVELLQVRRDRASRVGYDSAIDSNMAICLGDDVFMKRLVQLIRVTNYAPDISQAAPYHMMSHFPWIPDTLLMLGLGELESWDDIDRLERLAQSQQSDRSNQNVENSNDLRRSRGAVGTMLESLVDPLMRNEAGTATHIGHIIHVINAAQRAGIPVRHRSMNRDSTRVDESSRDIQGGTVRNRNNTNDDGSFSDIALLANQMMFQRLQLESGSENGFLSRRRVHATSPSEAANELQFNALLLAPYQVEILFVLCTLLGGRRKIDAQNLLAKAGLVQALDDMFSRLSWGFSVDDNDFNQENGGIHGPGCECNPESALRVQYLRLLHNFCDRDFDNYEGRRLLLSNSERNYIFLSSGKDIVTDYEDGNVKRPGPEEFGLLSKIVDTLMKEEEDSPYKFWLASCIESFLRGSSDNEQIFTAHSGLLQHLLTDILSGRIHCAGSLQTSFDLMGELCKGNIVVLESLLKDLNESSFRRLMSIAANNLVDSNVFIRGLIFCVEKERNSSDLTQLMREGRRFSSLNDIGYLSHSWRETVLTGKHDVVPSFSGNNCAEGYKQNTNKEQEWFVPNTFRIPQSSRIYLDFDVPEYAKKGLIQVGDYGWYFATDAHEHMINSDIRHINPCVWKISCFLIANRARILRDLLSVVNINNINHENICCLNTAIVLSIFSYRHSQLDTLLNEIRSSVKNYEEPIREVGNDFYGDDSALNTMKSLRFSFHIDGEIIAKDEEFDGNGDKDETLSNFRQLLWFWKEYYMNRGRDRLSLEFSSHLRFKEWKTVVSKLCADNDSKMALSHQPVPVPRSPYKRPPRSRF